MIKPSRGKFQIVDPPTYLNRLGYAIATLVGEVFTVPVRETVLHILTNP